MWIELLASKMVHLDQFSQWPQQSLQLKITLDQIIYIIQIYKGFILWLNLHCSYCRLLPNAVQGFRKRFATIIVAATSRLLESLWPHPNCNWCPICPQFFTKSRITQPQFKTLMRSAITHCNAIHNFKPLWQINSFTNLI